MKCARSIAKTHILKEHIGCTCYANDQTYSYAGDIYHAETSNVWQRQSTEWECTILIAGGRGKGGLQGSLEGYVHSRAREGSERKTIKKL